MTKNLSWNDVVSKDEWNEQVVNSTDPSRK